MNRHLLHRSAHLARRYFFRFCFFSSDRNSPRLPLALAPMTIDHGDGHLFSALRSQLFALRALFRRRSPLFALDSEVGRATRPGGNKSWDEGNRARSTNCNQLPDRRDATPHCVRFLHSMRVAAPTIGLPRHGQSERAISLRGEFEVPNVSKTDLYDRCFI